MRGFQFFILAVSLVVAGQAFGLDQLEPEVAIPDEVRSAMDQFNPTPGEQGCYEGCHYEFSAPLDKRRAPSFKEIAKRYSPAEMKSVMKRVYEEGSQGNWSDSDYTKASMYSQSHIDVDEEAVNRVADWFVDLAGKYSEE